MDRRNFLQASLTVPALAAVGCASPDGPRPMAVPRGDRVLFKGGLLLTMAPVSKVLRGDLLVEKGKIAAIAPSISAGDAEVIDASDRILMPGFVETHRHTWQSCLRHLGANWSAAQYFQFNFFKFGVIFRPEDVYAANLIGRLAALDGGITTLLDWSHIQNTPAHADAAVAALRDAGARSVFAMGWPQAPNPAIWISKSTTDIPDDIRRVRKQHFSSNEGMVQLAMAGRGPDFAVMDQVARDLRIARELDIRTTIHIGFAVAGGIRAMNDAKLLGPDITHVHVRDSTDDELQMIKDSGGTASISPLDEMLRVRWRRGLPPVVRSVQKGLVVSLSCDSESTSAGDMFSIMRSTLSVGRVEAANPPDSRPEPQNFNAANSITTKRLLEMATVDGAKTIGQEMRIGTLEVGKDADLLMMQATSLLYYPMQDPVDAIVAAADTSAIDAVFVRGRAVKMNGRLVDIALVNRARRLATESRQYLFDKTGYKPA
ncbi:amidohydrolase family protein [Caenimonas terrae]|uniref:Amidohydrolase family protein n=1 Tax=Caenimonas terrae TaxID=696074 RepID=A0ABW0NHH2_9BURK